MLMGISDDAAYAGQGGDFFRRALRVAAGHHNTGVRIFAMNTADGGASVLVGSGGHSTGIEDHESGFRGLAGSLQPALPQLALYGGAVRLGSAAAEICHVESCHVSILT